jgi:hypothetical protein
MQTAAAMANNYESGGLRTDGLQRPEPAHLQGNLINPLGSAEQGRCRVTGSETDVPLSKARVSLHAGRILAQRFNIVVGLRKMNPLKVFEGDEARIKDDRFKRFISQKRETLPSQRHTGFFILTYLPT